MMQWNGRIPAGTAASNMTELNDFMATTADLLGYALPWNSAPDSYSMKGVLLGQSGSPTHTTGVETSNGGAYSLRQINDQGNEWKLIFTSGDGQSVGGIDPLSTITNFNSLQLYNLTTDPGERTNLLAGGGAATMQQPALAMQSVVRGYILNGRSTPAPGWQSADYRQQNVFRVDFGLSTQTTPGTGWNNVAGAAGTKPSSTCLWQTPSDKILEFGRGPFGVPFSLTIPGSTRRRQISMVPTRTNSTDCLNPRCKMASTCVTARRCRSRCKDCVSVTFTTSCFMARPANSGEFSLFTVTGVNSDQKGIAP